MRVIAGCRSLMPSSGPHHSIVYSHISDSNTRTRRAICDEGGTFSSGSKMAPSGLCIKLIADSGKSSGRRRRATRACISEPKSVAPWSSGSQRKWKCTYDCISRRRYSITSS